MQHSFLQFEFSAWLIILCLALAASGAYLLYSKDAVWSKTIRYLLAVLRFICIFMLSLLLLGPILNQINNTVEKPTWVIGIDNSSSIATAIDSSATALLLNQTDALKSSLEAEGYLVNLRTLSDNIDHAGSVAFDAQSTNINSFLKNVQSDYEGRNLAGVVLVSDGIYNRGLSPLYAQYHFPIHTVGIGDTIPKNDLYIQEIKHNKISYQGNSFPIIATVGNKGYEGSTTVRLTNKGKVLGTKEIQLSANQPITQVAFEVEASQNGMQKFRVEVDSKAQEDNTTNNRQHAYIDIVDGKERILLIAAAPHPDIKAIAKSIDTRKNYELVTYIPSIDKDKPEGKFDLVIYHQLPNRSALSRRLMKEYPAQDIPVLLISGLRSDLRQIGNTLGYVSIQKQSNDNDQVTAAFNQDFSYFSLSEELQNRLNQMPPIEVPYSTINTSEGSSTLLYQRLGNVVTQNPLILIDGTSEVRSALLLGEGIWRWRLYEYNQKGNNEAFDELILKLVQYLATKVDKRKFKCAPIQNEITTNQSLVFETEVYNDLYDLTFGQSIDLTLTDESGEHKNYSFINTESNNRYTINGLPSGIYQYDATANINNIAQTVRGELVITDQQIESLNTTANHHLLQALSQKNNGSFQVIDDLPIADQLRVTKAQGIVHSAASFSSLINLEWLLVFFLLLLSIEWFTRKYNGSY
jgi:hypothetical protein